MKIWTLIVALLFAATPALFAEGMCGDAGLSCGDEEHCCEHVIAMFSDDHSIAPPYVEGRCVAKEQKCADFWCGNRQCKSGIFGAPSVCCINTPDQGSASQYSCAFSELSCPGNSQQLSIRSTTPTRTLQRG